MTIRFQVHPDQGLVRVKLEGHVEPPDIGEYRRALAADAEFSPALPRLIDVRGMALPPSTQEIRQLAATILRPGAHAQARRAVVAERDAVFGMFRMLESLVDSGSASPVRVFRREQDALSWLGVEPKGPAGTTLVN